MFLYLHGFASGPSSSKARLFADAFRARGLELVVPQLDEGDFEHLTLGAQRRLIERLLGPAPRPHVLIGSSMGGYLALLHAQAHGAEAVVAMAPAVEFARRLQARSPEDFRRWQERGVTEVDHYAYGRRMPVRFELIREAAAHDPWPRVEAPLLVLQGRNDDVVPAPVVEHWAGEQPRAQLRLFDSGHELVDVSGRLLAETFAFLASIPTVTARWPQLARP